MSKGKLMVIAPPYDMSVVEVDLEQNDLGDEVRKHIGGWMEVVHPSGLMSPYIMVVDEGGGLKDNQELNIFGSMLYNTRTVQIEDIQPIIGKIVIMKEGMYDGDMDILALDDQDIEKLNLLYKKIIGMF